MELKLCVIAYLLYRWLKRFQGTSTARSKLSDWSDSCQEVSPTSLITWYRCGLVFQQFMALVAFFFGLYYDNHYSMLFVLENCRPKSGCLVTDSATCPLTQSLARSPTPCFHCHPPPPFCSHFLHLSYIYIVGNISRMVTCSRGTSVARSLKLLALPHSNE